MRLLYIDVVDAELPATNLVTLENTQTQIFGVGGAAEGRRRNYHSLLAILKQLEYIYNYVCPQLSYTHTQCTSQFLGWIIVLLRLLDRTTSDDDDERMSGFRSWRLLDRWMDVGRGGFCEYLRVDNSFPPKTLWHSHVRRFDMYIQTLATAPRPLLSDVVRLSVVRTLIAGFGWEASHHRNVCVRNAVFWCGAHIQ